MEEHSKRSPLDIWLNVAAFALVILFNTLANALPLGGQTTGAISDKYNSLFTPAGFTFSIWGLIYLTLLGFVIRQALDRPRDRAFLREIGLPFKINCLGNALWIVAWHYDQLVLSMVIMLLLLGSLIWIYRTPGFALSPFWLTRLPFSLYLGWITVATIANFSVLQNAWGLDALWFSAVAWTIIKLGLAGLIGILVALTRKDAVFVLVIAWAAYGISAGQSATPAVSSAATILWLLSLMTGILAAGLQFRSKGV